MTALICGSGEGASNSVAKIRASDGVLLGTFPVGNFACGVAFDGSYIWVSNNGGKHGEQTTYRHRRHCRYLPCWSKPLRLGPGWRQYLVVNQGGNSVTKLRSSDGTNLATIGWLAIPPGAIAYDGSNMWVANQTFGTVTKLRASDGYP